MKLIFALGNPDAQYTNTRHNVGFLIADEYARRHDETFQMRSKFKAELAKCMIHSEQVIVAKPTTYYNLVGESYRLLADYYNISPSDTLIIADDLALPLGTIRLREGGSGGGSNGIKSINAHGGAMTRRIRVGVGSELRERMHDDAAFVLGTFTASERDIIADAQDKIQASINDFVMGEFSPTTHS